MYIYPQMSLRRLSITNLSPIFSSPITRPSTCLNSTSPHDPQQQEEEHSQQQKQPNAFDQSFLNWVTSVLSKQSLDSSKCKHILTHLSPQQFDALFVEIRYFVNPRIMLNLLSFGSESCGFRFTVRSYCLLIRLLVFLNSVASARLLLIRLIDCKLPIVFENPETRHLEIASALADLNSASDLALIVQTFDLLIHVYCTQFKDFGFNVAVDVFQLIANKGLYLSLKTCNLLLSSLVKANELQKSYVVFDIICRGVTPDVYLFSTFDQWVLQGR